MLERLAEGRAVAVVILAVAAAVLATVYFGMWPAITQSVWSVVLPLVLCAISAGLAYAGGAARRNEEPPHASLSQLEASRLIEASSATAVLEEPEAAAILTGLSGAMASRGYRVRTGPRVAEIASPGWNRFVVPGVYALIALALAVVVAGHVTRPSQTVDLPLGEVVGLTGGARVSALDLVETAGGTPSSMLEVVDTEGMLASGRLVEGAPLNVGRRVIEWESRGISAVLSVETSAGAMASRLPYLLEYPDAGTTARSDHSLTAFSEAGAPIAGLRVQLDAPGADAPLRSVPATATAAVSVAPVYTGEFGAPAVLELGRSLQLDGGYHLRFVAMDDWIRIRVMESRWLPFAAALLAISTAAVLVSCFIAPRRAIIGVVLTEDGATVNVLVTADAPARAFSSLMKKEVAARALELGTSGRANDSGAEQGGPHEQ